MNHRLLLGSTALVGAGILFAGTAQAQAPIKVIFGGYTEVGVRAATDETNNPAPDQGYNGFMDTELHITAQGTTDSGVIYGSYIELDVYSDENNGSSSTNADEANLFFSGNFGRIELGRQDGAEDTMFVGAAVAQAGTGGLDGDTTNLASVYHVSYGDSAKATYFSPRVGGFQLGASVTPDQSDNGGRDDNENFTNAVTAGANWVGAFSGVDLSFAAVAGYIKNPGEVTDPQTNSLSNNDEKDWSVGGLLGAGGLSFGVTFGQNTDFNQGTFTDLGLKYGFGGANVSVGYVNWNPDHGKTQNVYVASADVGLMPGVTLKGDVSYNTEDPGKNDSRGLNPGDTWAGIMSVQLDY